MSLVTVVAGKALLSLADLGCTPEDITDVLAEMCKMHEKILGDVDREMDECLEK